ncbi:MAG: hypothetical protein ACFFCP_11310 [Promethearchaeota archaeon]
MNIRTDSRSIAILSIFAAMIIALEILPIPLLTDIPLFAGFTLDPTGIPIVIVFLSFGAVFSLVLIPIMWITIAYRNPVGSVFKGFAEFFTLLGLIVARVILKHRAYDWKIAGIVYAGFGITFRAVGMYIANIYLLELLYGMPMDGAILLSASFVIPNIIQALINIVIGILIFLVIPENLKVEARLGQYGEDQDKYIEISEDELNSQ